MRETVIVEIGAMMVAGMYAPLTGDREAFDMALEGINTSASETTRGVESLTSESLVSWQEHYADAIGNDVLVTP